MIVRPRNEWTICAPVVRDPSNGNAAEIDPVIPLLSSDEAEAAPFALSLEISARNLERRIAGFRARVDEEDMIKSIGRERGDLARECERIRVRELEGWRKINLRGGSSDCFNDRSSSVPGIDAPKARTGIEKLSSALVKEIHPLGPRKNPWRRFELTVGRERKPESVEIVRTRQDRLPHSRTRPR